MLRHLFSFRCFPADLGELDRHLEHVRLLTFSPLQNSLSMFVRKFRLIVQKKKMASDSSVLLPPPVFEHSVCSFAFPNLLKEYDAVLNYFLF